MDPVVLYLLLRRRKQRRHRWWIHPLNRMRGIWGEHLKVQAMQQLYPERFFQYTRMLPKQFDFVLENVRSEIQKLDTNFRTAIPADLRLFVTLRYLATGDSLSTIATNYSMGHASVWKIVRETTPIIWDKLNDFVKAPRNEDEWNHIEEGFRRRWNYPNCLGAIDGKHVDIEAPGNTGSLYYNYKGRFSIVLLATCDADYCFTTVDVGAYGRQSDAGVFSISGFGNSLEKGLLSIPGPKILPSSDKELPCTFVGDEAFPLKCYMMRPFPGRELTPRRRIFNYRLSRARRVIENTFGIMAMRFRIFRRPIQADPKHVVNIVKACIALHNFLKKDGGASQYCPAGYLDNGDEDNGAWRQGGASLALRNLTQLSSNRHTEAAKAMRDSFADYFIAEGSVSWQEQSVGLK